MNKETVCAVVVTYNRKGLLIECLEALENQSRPIDAIYIVDNASTDGTPQLLVEKCYLDHILPSNLSEPYEMTSEKNQIPIHYLRMHENTGGAGGFHEGVKRAYKDVYDWIWIMDDDAEPEKDSLKKLEDYFNFKDISALSCKVMDDNTSIQLHHRGYINLKKMFPCLHIPLEAKYYKNKSIEIEFASFVGLMINREVVEAIGFPNKQFFIHNDDIDYCIRMRKLNKILLIPDSIIFHKDKAFSETTNNKGRTSYEKLWITYFERRNAVWVNKNYSLNIAYFYILMIIDYLKRVTGILLFDNNKIKRINFLTRSYLDGFKGIFDNDKPKRILYK